MRVIVVRHYKTLLNASDQILGWGDAPRVAGWRADVAMVDEALEPLERAAADLPRDPTVLEHLGDVYHRLGDAERAVRAWNRALEADPSSAEQLRAKIALHEAVRGSGGE